jgi:hypothetical protein
MPAKLLSFYLRVGTEAARLALSLTERVLVGAGRAIGLVDQDGAKAPEAERRPQPPTPEREPQPPASEPEPQRPTPTPPAPVAEQVAVDYEAEPPTPLDLTEELAKSIDDQPELVEELADPGAEDGAGATVEIDQPWEGYSKMKADAVIARLREASAAELAMVELYEGAHKRRQTVLAAAARRHKEITGPAAS